MFLTNNLGIKLAIVLTGLIAFGRIIFLKSRRLVLLILSATFFLVSTEVFAGTHNWMDNVPDNQPIAKMSIPGTHDSGAFYGASNIIASPYVKTQHWNIREQLNNGIRFLDMRLAYNSHNSGFDIYHGSFYQNISFNQVLDAVKGFLEDNSSEVVLMKIKQEHSTQSDWDFITRFNQAITGKSYISTTSTLSTLGNVRGKVVFISNVACASNTLCLPGIPWSQLGVQNYYHVLDIAFNTYTCTSSNPIAITLYCKRQLVFQKLDQAVESNYHGYNKLYLNFLSASIGATPHYFANTAAFIDVLCGRRSSGINSCVRNRLASKGTYSYMNRRINQYPYYGILAMDYPSTDLIKQIIKYNRNKALVGKSVVTLRNTHYGGNYLYASMVQYNRNKRQVFAWSESSSVPYGAYWVKFPLNTENHYVYYNTHYKEVLYASNDAVNNNRRTVHTWIPGDAAISNGIWRLGSGTCWDDPEGTTTTIASTLKNTFHHEYIYASSLMYDTNRRKVATWDPGVLVWQGCWTETPIDISE